MSFFASNNRIRVTNSGGTPVFDTDRKMPAILTTLSGTITTASYVGDIGEVYHDLGAAPAGTELVFPTFRLTYPDLRPEYLWLPLGVPISAVGSTLVFGGWSLDWAPEEAFNIAAFVTFVVGNGRLYLYLDYSDQEAKGIPRMTFNYKVYLGRFT